MSPTELSIVGVEVRRALEYAYNDVSTAATYLMEGQLCSKCAERFINVLFGLEFEVSLSIGRHPHAV